MVPATMKALRDPRAARGVFKRRTRGAARSSKQRLRSARPGGQVTTFLSNPMAWLPIRLGYAAQDLTRDCPNTCCHSSSICRLISGIIFTPRHLADAASIVAYTSFMPAFSAKKCGITFTCRRFSPNKRSRRFVVRTRLSVHAIIH